MLKEKVLSTIEKFKLFSPYSSVVFALSGGPDSVCLLSVLLSVKEDLNLRVYAAHFNHGLRGEESDRDEAFVRELCRRWGVPLKVGKGSVQKEAKGKNLEAVSRELRYAFLERAADEFGAEFIAQFADAFLRFLTFHPFKYKIMGVLKRNIDIITDFFFRGDVFD